MFIKKGDNIKVIAGKDRGKTAKILKVFPVDEKIMGEGVNMYKKHIRPKREGEKGETVSVTRPFSISNVMLICHSCGKPARMGGVREGKKKLRVCKKCEHVF